MFIFLPDVLRDCINALESYLRRVSFKSFFPKMRVRSQTQFNIFSRLTQSKKVPAPFSGKTVLARRLFQWKYSFLVSANTEVIYHFLNGYRMLSVLSATDLVAAMYSRKRRKMMDWKSINRVDTCLSPAAEPRNDIRFYKTPSLARALIMTPMMWVLSSASTDEQS